MAAARAWAAGTLAADRHKEPEALADARRWGFDEAALAGLLEELGGAVEDFAVWAANVPAVNAFLAVASQWRTALEPVEGGFRTFWVGLDYAGAKVALDNLEIAMTPRIWADLAVLEDAARAALNGEDDRWL